MQETFEPVEVEQCLCHRELCTRGELALEPLELEIRVVGGGVDRNPDEERRGPVDRLADVVHAFVQSLEQPDEPDRVDLVHAS